MPADIKVYKLTAGGVRELIDEWSETSKKLTQDALQKHLSSRYGFKVKFISEDWLKGSYKECWESNQALYEAISTCALLHAYPGPNCFSSKLNYFDYTLGEEVAELTKICGADAILFVYGVDHEATVGRNILMIWNMFVGAATGVTVIPLNPSIMTIGLVDGASGDVEWFKITPADTEYSFVNKGNIDTLIEWLTRDLISEK